MSEYYESNIEFIGRYNELKELDSILQKERVCIVQGSAAIGKTELVNHYLLNRKKIDRNNVGLVREYELVDTHDESEVLDDIVTKEIIVCEDIISIQKYIKTHFYDELLRSSAKKIILITRDTVSESSIPSVVVGHMTKEDSIEMIHSLLQVRVEESDKAILVGISDGNPFLLTLLIRFINKKSLSTSEVLDIWTLPEIVKLVVPYLKKESALLNENETIILQRLLVLGDIKEELYYRWSKEEPSDNERFMISLESKGFLIRTNGILRLQSFTKDFDFYVGIAYESCKNIADSILHDLENGSSVDEKYPERIIEFMMENNDAVSFVADYYRTRLHTLSKQAESKQSEFNAMREIIRSELKDVKDISFGIKERVDQINITVLETNAIVFRMDLKTDEFYTYLSMIIEQLNSITSNDTEVEKNLKELEEYAQHPNVSAGKRVFEIIGFLGSVASIVNCPQGEFLLMILKSLFASLGTKL